MTRLFLWACFILLFSMIETSFFRSLPGFLTLTPFVLACSVYLVQHQGMDAFAWWLPLHGLWLDLFAGGKTVFVVAPYVVAGLIVMYSAKHLFSNRSYYGVLSCACTGFAGLILTEVIVLYIQTWMHLSVDWMLFLKESGMRLLLLILLITLFYPFAKRIRTLLVSMSILPELRKTF